MTFPFKNLCWLTIFLFITACTEYQPPFTHHLTPDMSFAEICRVAADKGYDSYLEVADYKGYCLFSFQKKEGGQEVFLVVNEKRRPVLRTFGYGRLDEQNLVHFVEGILQHSLPKVESVCADVHVDC